MVAIDTGVIKGSMHHICQVYAVGKNIIGTLKSVEVRMGWASLYEGHNATVGQCVFGYENLYMLQYIVGGIIPKNWPSDPRHVFGLRKCCPKT